MMHKQISKITRTIQAQFPSRPIRGLSRLAQFSRKSLPSYSGIVSIKDGIQINLNTQNSVECGLMYSGVYQPALTHVLEQYKVCGGNYIDVGANLGFFTLLFAAWAGDSGHVCSVEANPQMVAKIQESIELNALSNVEIVEKAAHDVANETVQFYVSAYSGKSSLYSNLTQQVVEKIQIETTTLDYYLAQSSWSRVDVIKIDVEGNDGRVILGAAETIQRYKPLIVFEYKPLISEDLREQIAFLLYSSGYRLEYLLLNGERYPFEWHIPDNLPHVDVLCFPPLDNES